MGCSKANLNPEQVRCLAAVVLMLATVPVTLVVVAATVAKDFVLRALTGKLWAGKKGKDAGSETVTYLVTGGKMSKALVLARALKKSKNGGNIKVL